MRILCHGNCLHAAKPDKTPQDRGLAPCTRPIREIARVLRRSKRPSSARSDAIFVPAVPYRRNRWAASDRLLREHKSTPSMVDARKRDIRQCTDNDMKVICDRLNNTPRKCLGWKTPDEVVRGAGIAPRVCQKRTDFNQAGNCAHLRPFEGASRSVLPKRSPGW